MHDVPIPPLVLTGSGSTGLITHLSPKAPRENKLFAILIVKITESQILSNWFSQLQ